ncbi:MAG: DUF6141 family protein [Dehalococcoidia bacterium]|nr:DUF6141 family protein [Dehalococcoidia bacterium]
MAEEDSTEVLFREVQRFRQLWLWIILLSITAVCIYAAVEQLIRGKPFGNNPATDIYLIVIVIIFGLVFPLFFYYINLTTEVRNDGLYYRFFPLHCSFQRITLGDLKAYEVRTYKPLREYGGWGIRRGAKGKAYNVKGNRGVQLKRTNGELILIGSQRPEELARALELVLKRNT